MVEAVAESLRLIIDVSITFAAIASQKKNGMALKSILEVERLVHIEVVFYHP